MYKRQGLPLVEDAHSRELLDAYLKQYEKNDAQRRITSNNYKQAMVPQEMCIRDRSKGGIKRDGNLFVCIIIQGLKGLAAFLQTCLLYTSLCRK